jgi:hypothetical protein
MSFLNMRIRVAVVYFLLVFGAGFALGTARVLLVAPAIGSRAAELLETPLMVAIVAFVARRVTRRYAQWLYGPAWLHVGLLACGLMLAADIGVGVMLRDMTVREALFERDPLAGTAYYLALGYLALAPWLAARAQRRMLPPAQS